MLDIRTIIKGQPTIQKMEQRLQRNFLYALSVATNNAANQAQAVMRASLRQHFTIRRGEFIDRLVKIENADRARPDKLSTIIRISGPGNDFSGAKAGILSRHEPWPEGKLTHTRPDILDPTAMMAGRGGPFNIRGKSLQTGVPPRNLYPTALGLVPMRDASGKYFYALGRGSKGGSTRRKGKPARTTPYTSDAAGRVRIEGKRDTFMVNPLLQKTKYKFPIIFQRTADPKRPRVLWIFKGTVTNKPRLAFRTTVRRAFDVAIPGLFRTAFRDALSS